jgi:hypothetical protein
MNHWEKRWCIEGGNIARALRRGHNLYGPGCGAIDYEVSAKRPEQNRVRGQVLALMAYARRVTNGVKRIEQLAYPPVGGVNIIRGDIVPYVWTDARDLVRRTQEESCDSSFYVSS